MKAFNVFKNAAGCISGNMLKKCDAYQKRLQKATVTFSKTISLLTVGITVMHLSTLLVMAEATVADASTLMGSILGMILAVFRYVGIALIVWGVIQFVLATKRTDAESKSDAIQTIMCGIVLTALKTIFNSFDLGVTISDITL